MPTVGLLVRVIVDELVDPGEVVVPILMRPWDGDGRNVRCYQKLIWTIFSGVLLLGLRPRDEDGRSLSHFQKLIWAMIYQIAYGSAGDFLNSLVDAHVLGLCSAVLDSYAYQSIVLYVFLYE